MIYLYAGLGMAMLLPILVGLQTAVAVAELEQGELAMQVGDGKVFKDWRLRLSEKNAFLQRQADLFPRPEVGCPSIGENYALDSSNGDCVYWSKKEGAGLGSEYVSRFFRRNAEWSSCLVIAGDQSSRCVEEPGAQ